MGRYTPDFSLFCGHGPPRGMSIKDLVSMGATRLEMALQTFVNEELNDESHADPECRLRMKPYDRMSSVKGYNARVRFEMDYSEPEDDAKEVDGLVKLTFT